MEEDKCCMNCANSYVVNGKVKCRLEEEIPFFDMEEEILDPQLDNCSLWENGDDGK